MKIKVDIKIKLNQILKDKLIKNKKTIQKNIYINKKIKN
jgi:hypothetical protein